MNKLAVIFIFVLVGLCNFLYSVHRIRNRKLIKEKTSPSLQNKTQKTPPSAIPEIITFISGLVIFAGLILLLRYNTFPSGWGTLWPELRKGTSLVGLILQGVVQLGILLYLTIFTLFFPDTVLKKLGKSYRWRFLGKQLNSLEQQVPTYFTKTHVKIFGVVVCSFMVLMTVDLVMFLITRV